MLQNRSGKLYLERGQQMNSFELKLKEHTEYYSLKAEQIIVLVVNIGYKCNLRCTHCFVESSPERTEIMSLDTMNSILDVLRKHGKITTLEISGGAIELNPHFKYFAKSASDMGKKVLAVTNLTLFSEPGMEDMPEFLAGNKITVFTSLSSYIEEEMEKQRGKGSYKKVIAAMKKLNEVGYGKEGRSLDLHILFNPLKTEMPAGRQIVEDIFREKLKEMHGITFNHLITLNNIPIGRMRKSLSEDEFQRYMKKLEEKFNPGNIKNLICRQMLDVAPDGTLYDCGYWQIQKTPIRTKSAHINNFDYKELKNREIVTTPLCFACTAAEGQEQLDTWCGDL